VGLVLNSPECDVSAQGDVHIGQIAAAHIATDSRIASSRNGSDFDSAHRAPNLGDHQRHAHCAAHPVDALADLRGWMWGITLDRAAVVINPRRSCLITAW